MRFASLQGSGNGAKYAAAGKAVADSSARVFDVQRETGPDYAGISKTAMKTASEEKIAGMRAEASVTQAGIKSVAGMKQSAIKTEVFKKGEEIKNRQRKAGGIAAIGKIAGAGFLAATDNTKGRERPKADRQSILDSFNAKNKASQSAYDSAVNDLDEFKPSTGDTPGKVTTGTSASSTSSPSSDKSNFSQNYMTAFNNAGWSPEQSAAMVGHLKVESDNFRADTEYAPNTYGTKGRGHLQWTDTGTSGGRRTNFENYAKKNNLSPTSYEANSGFLLSEMQGNHGNHWTNGGSYQGFLQTTSLQDASVYLQNNYIRPGVPHTDRRLLGAQLALDNYQR